MTTENNTEQALTEICDRVSDIEETLIGLTKGREAVEALPSVATDGMGPLWVKVEVGYSLDLKMNWNDYTTREAISALYVGQIHKGEDGFQRIQITPWPEEKSDAEA